MSYGIAGAHRVGKTTLCESLSNETDFGLLEMRVGNVFSDLGIDPAEPMSFQTRLGVQNEILDRAIKVWAAEPTHFFADRTPIDMLAYTTADMDGQICLTDIEMAGYMEYRSRCYDALHRFFGVLIIVQPGIDLVDPGEKPTAKMDKGFIEHLNSIVLGLAFAPECKLPVYIVPREVVDLDARLSYCVGCIRHAYTYVNKLKKMQAFH